MCGIAGYSLSSRSSVDRTLAAQALLAGIADRGADAVGYAYRGGPDTASGGTKAPAGARRRPAAVARPGPQRGLLRLHAQSPRDRLRVHGRAAPADRAARRDVPRAARRPRRAKRPLPPRPQLRRGECPPGRPGTGPERLL